MSFAQKLLWAFVLLAMLGTIAASAWAISHPHEELPEILDLGEWSMPSTEGKAFGTEQLKGRVTLVDFIFTYCSGPCPVMTAGMKEIQDALKGERDVQLVTISVDPDRDTPEVLRTFAAKWGYDPERWTFLTGRDVYRVVYDNFKLVARPTDGPPEQNIIHSSQIVLVDRDARVRGLFNYAGQDPETRAWNGKADVAAQIVAEARHLARKPDRLFSVRTLPRVNSTLNGICAVLLCLGLVFIKKKRIGLHKAMMVSALCVSVAFLACYLYYHAKVGSVPFARTGWLRPVYFGVLITHVILAAMIVPMALTSAWLGWKERLEQHKRLSRWTLPLWLYVSVTGILVYTLLYAI